MDNLYAIFTAPVSCKEVGRRQWPHESTSVLTGNAGPPTPVYSRIDPHVSKCLPMGRHSTPPPKGTLSSGDLSTYGSSTNRTLEDKEPPEALRKEAYRCL